MFQIEKLQSLDDPRVAPYRTMRRQFDHWKQEIFVAEGEKVVRRLIESSIPMISVLMSEAKLAELEPLLRKRGEPIVAFAANKALLEQLTGFQLYQGVLALAKVPVASTLDEILSLSARPRLLVALDGLSNSENMGVVIRNCVAFGVQALILNETCAPPYLRRAVRNSMGTVFKLPYARSAALPTTLRELQKAGIHVIAAHPHTEKSISHADFSGDSCILFGSEGDGISAQVLAACSEVVAIPMQSGTDSLNVATASAVFLYEAQSRKSIPSLNEFNFSKGQIQQTLQQLFETGNDGTKGKSILWSHIGIGSGNCAMERLDPVSENPFDLHGRADSVAPVFIFARPIKVERC